MKTGPFSGQQPGKETLKAMHRTRSKIAHGDCNPWTSKRQRSRGGSCSFKHDLNKQGKGKRSEKTLEWRRKSRYQRKKAQRHQSVWKVKYAGMLSLSAGTMPKGIGMRLLAPTMFTPQISKWTCAFKHTSKASEDKSGDAFLVIKKEETNE